jgi:hypothetical protein
MEQKALLKSFVKSTDVSKSEVTVNHILTMPPLNADKETMGVLDSTYNSSPVVQCIELSGAGFSFI